MLYDRGIGKKIREKKTKKRPLARKEILVMKTRTKRMLLRSLCVALLAVCGVFAFAATDTEYKVVDHVVYQFHNSV